MFLFPVTAWCLMSDKLQSDWKNKGLPPFVKKEWKILDLTFFSLSAPSLAAATCTILHIFWFSWFSGRQRVFLFSCSEWSLQFTTPVWCSGFVHSRKQHVAAHWPFSCIKPACQVFRSISLPCNWVQPVPYLLYWSFTNTSIEESCCNY